MPTSSRSSKPRAPPSSMKAVTDKSGWGAAGSREPLPSLELFDSPWAWRMVAAAFVAMCAVYGVAYSFGAFLKPMAAEFGARRSATSAVFSITVLVWCFLGPITGHLSDRFGPRIVVASGALVMGLGLALTSMIDRLWLGYLTYGLGVGVGVACAYVPMVAVVGGWFLRRRNTALGVAVAGIGFGTVCGAPIAAASISHIGWRATYLAFAAAVTVILLGCAWIVERPPVHVTPSRAGSLRNALRSPAFGFLYASSVTVSIVIFVPFVYLPSFAHDRGASEFASRPGRHHRRRERRGTHGTWQFGRSRRRGASVPGELSRARAQLRDLAQCGVVSNHGYVRARDGRGVWRLRRTFAGSSRAFVRHQSDGHDARRALHQRRIQRDGRPSAGGTNHRSHWQLPGRDRRRIRSRGRRLRIPDSTGQI